MLFTGEVGQNSPAKGGFLDRVGKPPMLDREALSILRDELVRFYGDRLKSFLSTEATRE